MKVRLRAMVLSILLVAKLYSVAEAQTVDYSVHANIIYHITKYMQWPDSSKTGDFVIGVYGDDAAYQEFKTLIVYKHIGSQKITIAKINNIDSLNRCQMLFVTEDKSREIKKIIGLTRRMPTLIITQYPRMNLRDNEVNFVMENQKLKVEMNKNNIENKKIKIASELLSLITSY